MAAPKRPSLTNLAVQKPAAAAAPAEPPASNTAPADPAPRAATTRKPVPRRSHPDVKTVQVRINRRGWAALRRLADEKDEDGVSLESLMVEALNDVLLKHGQPPIVERRTGKHGTEGPEGE